MALLLQIYDFLPGKLNQELCEYAVGNEDKYLPATTSGAADYRKALVLHNPQHEAVDEILSKVKDLKSSACRMLGIDNRRLNDIDCQITASGHGHYYKMHNDNGSADAKTRFLTYVYYFHKEGGYIGGELGIKHHSIAPVNNSLVLFDSSTWHEVKRVESDGEFGNSRFTVNGWIA